MRFEELSWMDIAEYLKHDDRLMLVVGACEQHGYLSLLADVKIPLALADAASKQSGVLVAPALNFGSSAYFMAYPGTLSLRISTFLDIIEDLVRSANKQGFRRILILNGHGGNEGARSRLSEVVNDLPDLRLLWHSWWNTHSVLTIAQQHEIKPCHANWLEAFPFNIVAEMPEEEKIPPRDLGLMNAEEIRNNYGDGSFGGRYRVGESIMQEIFEVALQDVLYLLKFE